MTLLLAITIATATSGSRWYVFPFFSTLVVLSMLLVSDDQTPAHWFLERLLLTLAGVALALLSAWAVPLEAEAPPAHSRSERP